MNDKVFSVQNDFLYVLYVKKSSGVGNWCLDEFFEEFICGRWYIYLEQTTYYSCRPISCWLSSLAVEYHLVWTIISYVVWYSSPADDIHLEQSIFNRWKRYSFKRDESHLWWLILEITINHWSWNSTTGDHNQPLGMIIDRHRWYIVGSRRNFCKRDFCKNWRNI
jgi:hypothetical protein